jgi:hypothetical protein
MRIQGRLVNHAGVVIQAARNRQVQGIPRFGHTECTQLLQDAAQFVATFLEQRGSIAQVIEPRQCIVMAVRTYLRKGHQLVDAIGLQVEAFAGKCLAYGVPAPLVQLVQFAQDCELLLALDADAFEITTQQLAMVELYGEIANRQPFEHGRDDRRDFGIESRRQVVFSDNVDVALVELTETAALGTLTTINALHLVAAEWKRQFVLMFGHVACQRHSQVETQGQLRQAVGCTFFQRASGLHEIHLPLGLASGLCQQDLGQLHHRRFHWQEAKTLKGLADRVQHPLESDLVAGQQLHDPGRRAWFDQGHGSGTVSSQV